MVTFIKILTFVLMSCALSGCINHQMHKDIGNKVDRTAKEYAEAVKSSPISEPAVVRLSRPPIDATPISNETDPEWFSRPYNTSATMPFGILARNAFESTGVIVSFDNDLDQARQASVIYDGTLRGVLDEMSLASGYAFTVHNNRVQWHQMKTEIFDISILPGDTSYRFGTLDNENNSSDAAETVVIKSRDSYSETFAELTPWADLKKLIDSMVSEDGSAFVSESAGIITVTDYPSNVLKISSVIDDYTKRMTRQAMVQLEIITVEHNDARSDAIDWDLIKSTTGNTIEFINPVSEAFTAFNSAPTSLRVIEGDGHMAGSEILLQALNEQVKASLKVTPRMIAMHNQISEYNVTTDTGYLASSNTTITEGIAETTLQGGLITAGLTINMLTQIDEKNDEIYFDLTASISELRSINLIESNGAALETPEIDKTQVKHRGRVKFGSTVLVSGLERILAKNTVRENFDTGALGAADSFQTKVETLILMTPVMMD